MGARAFRENEVARNHYRLGEQLKGRRCLLSYQHLYSKWKPLYEAFRRENPERGVLAHLHNDKAMDD